MGIGANGFYDKFPAEIREFDFDASDVLFGGDTIASVDVVPLSGGIAIASSSFVGNIVTFRVSGGDAGSVAKAVANVTTTAGLFRQGVIYLVIKPL